ncbi:MAG: hypothetical protein LLG02_08390 [Pelosinus sp.]|nr:hypothetical protein [Pelosinus sp.]
MQTVKIRKISAPPQLLNKALLRIVVLYLLALIAVFSYIPFDIEYAAFDTDGHFSLSPAIIEYAWLNPPPEDARKMIAGVNWSRIYLELTTVTIIAGIACGLSKK